MARMVVGLTGGIGSGKSTVAAILAELGAFVVDADRIARDVVAPHSDGLQQIVSAFGEDVLQPDGSLDRAKLAAIVFADPEKRSQLDAITHPRIAELTQRQFAQATDQQIIVHDVPLLTELGLAPNYGHVIVVDSPDEIRVQRLVERGLTEEDARARMASQATREQRLAIADYVVDNSGSRESLRHQVEDVWDDIEKQA